MINKNIKDIMRKKREYFLRDKEINRTILKVTAICGIIVLTTLSFTCFDRSVFAKQRDSGKQAGYSACFKNCLEIQGRKRRVVETKI